MRNGRRYGEDHEVKPILPGGRGAAVEDIQRRLLSLGYDLGPTGVDGVFLGRTREAIVRFQEENAIDEEGFVGEKTWAALVDATFALGDRMLYLRLPYFHGRDVQVLQGALNSLGFSCGEEDGIFGAATERAVREFQRNCGQPVDGIAGAETVRTIEHLRHVWDGKEVRVPESGRVAPGRISDVLSRVSIALVACDVSVEDLTSRVVNLALATDAGARVIIAEGGDAQADVVAHLCSEQPAGEYREPVVTLSASDDARMLAQRIRTALQVTECHPRELRLVVGELGAEDGQDAQRTVVLLLDALCLALAR